MNPKGIGEISECMVLAALIKQGKVVLIPFGNNQRYDLVIDEDGTFVRVQVKTGRLINGVVKFQACSINGFTRERRNYRDQADVFCVYCPETDAVYRVPVSSIGRRQGSLRVSPTKGGPKTTIRWAEDYLVQ